MNDEYIVIPFYPCGIQLNFILQNNFGVKSSAFKQVVCLGTQYL
jgi:hypothetical protein